MKKESLTIDKKVLLSLDEAAEYTGLGMHKLREISNGDGCSFVLWNGSKRMFKREKLLDYLNKEYSI